MFRVIAKATVILVRCARYVLTYVSRWSDFVRGTKLRIITRGNCEKWKKKDYFVQTICTSYVSTVWLLFN